MLTVKAVLLDPIHLRLNHPVTMHDQKLYIEAVSLPEQESPILVKEEILNGTPVIRNTRIPVYMVLEYLRNGYSLQEIASVFSGLPEEKIRRVLAHLGRLFEVDVETYSG